MTQPWIPAAQTQSARPWNISAMQTHDASAALTQVSTLAAAATTGVEGSGALTQTSTLTVSASATAVASTSLAQNSTLTASADIVSFAFIGWGVPIVA